MKFIGSVLRIVVAITWILTSLYSLLAYVPFTYRQVISINLIPALQHFARLQPVLLITLTILLTIFILRFEKGKTITIEDRRELLIVGAAALFIGIWILPNRITNDSSSLILSFVCLLPPLWLGFFTLRDVSERRAFPLSPSCVMLSATLAGLFTAIISALTYDSFGVETLLTTAAAALLVGSIAALFEQFINSARLSLQSSLVFYSVGLTFLIGVFVVNHFCSSIAFFGPFAWCWSFVFASAVSFTLVGIGARTSFSNNSEDLHSLRQILRGVFPKRLELPGLFFLAIGYWFLQRTVRGNDWNGLIQKSVAFGFFIVSFLIIVLIVPDLGSSKEAVRNKELRNLFITSLSFLVLLGIISIRFFQEKIRVVRLNDPVFMLTKPVLFPEYSESTFFAELQSRTNLPSSQIVNLQEIELKPAVTRNRPHPLIFIFVIDSLRRDYLSPYNSKVSFTPNIGSFANEATVFRNSFTRYGATALSEPSIWAGRMFPHKLYPQPFESINLLHKLIEREEYDVWLSRDSILKEILKPGKRDRDLDVGVGTQELDFCKTTDEIVSRLKENPSLSPFVFSQSQNIHVSVLARNAVASSADQKIPTGFHVPYAMALRDLDVCFGNFIDQLKLNNLYDKSMIILTSDHGDSLGEEGRFGHAYTIFPEIMRIPLLIRLPKSMQEQNPRQDITFSTDIAPTLASLLGYSIDSANWWDGRPLFSRKGEASYSAPVGPHLVMSSYGPVAGLISDSGDSISIADAINFSDYLYQIKELDSSRETPSSQSKGENHRLLKEKIDQLYSAFGL